MKTDRVKYYIDRSGFGIQAMVILMALSIAFRIIGCWGLWNDHNFAVLQIALPIVSALLYILSIWFFGKHAVWLSFVPVVLGAVFFIVKSLGFESKLHMILCILLYIGVIALYFCTVFGIIRTKWFLVLLFLLPFLYHIFVEDLAALRDVSNPVNFADGMQEMSVLCVMLGLFFTALSLKKTVIETETELPKIKDPIVVTSDKNNAEETSQDTVQVQENKHGENEDQKKPDETDSDLPIDNR